MINTNRISKRIKLHEGLQDKIYLDTLGNPTIGYGHLVTPEDKFFFKKKYSKKLLLDIFMKDLLKSIFDFKNNYKYKKLQNNTQEVIIEMVFQLGIKKVLTFKKFNHYINNKQLYLAALEMMNSRWYKQTPKTVNL